MMYCQEKNGFLQKKYLMIFLQQASFLVVFSQLLMVKYDRKYNV